MNKNYEQLIQQAYAAFNRRDIPAALALMQPDVKWPNGWEGGYVHGQKQVEEYWTRQWKEVDPTVHPKQIFVRSHEVVEVSVHQIAKDMQGKILFDGQITHVYTFKEGLIAQMDIEQ